MLANLSTQNAADVAIMGDFNHPEIDWESVTTEKNINHSSQHFIDAIRWYAALHHHPVCLWFHLSVY